jgi:hypothetical protein
VVALDGDLHGERRGVWRPATGVRDGADVDSPALKFEVDSGGIVVKMATQLDVGGPAHGERTE